ESETKMRSLIIGLMLYAEDSSIEEKCMRMFEQGVEQIDPELRHLVIGAAVKYSTDNTVITKLLDTYKTTSSADLRDDICSGLTHARNAKQIEILLQAITDSTVVRSQDVFRWFAYLIRSRYAREATWNWLTDNWEWIEKTFSGDKSYDYFPQYAANGLVTREHLAKYKEFFVPKLSVPALNRVIKLGIKEIEGRITTLESDGEAVREKLRSLQL